MKYAADQPAPGDVVLRCPHLSEIAAGRSHWYRFDPPVAARTPYGETVQARWLRVCEPCHQTYPVSGIPVTSHMVRSDEEPIIERVTID